jgi:SOS-response transcriptional repressor LexA
MMGLTPKQAACVRAIRDLTTQGGVAPSYCELMAVLDLSSKSAIHRLIQSLKQRGVIETLPNHARSIRIIPDGGFEVRSLTTGRLHAMRDAIDAEIRRRAI